MNKRTSLFVLAALTILASGLVSLSVAQPADGPRTEGPRTGPAAGGERATADRPTTPGGGAWRPTDPQAEQMERMINMIRGMQRICFDPATSGMIAVGGLKDEVRRKPEDVIKDLEGLLMTTKTQGLRNALHMTLKDLYKGQANDDKVLEHLHAMVAENDAVLQANPPSRRAD